MTLQTSYSARFDVRLPVEGDVHRLVLSTAGGSPGVVFLKLRPPGVTIARGADRGGVAEPLVPFAVTTLAADLVDTTPGSLYQLAGRGDDYVRADYYSGYDDVAGTWTWHEFSGFLEPETFTEVPGKDSTVRLSFADGVGMALGQRLVVDPTDEAFDAGAHEALLETLRRSLAELATADGVAGRIVSRVGIAPDLLVGDPLAGLRARHGAWVDGDQAARYQDAALRSVASALGCRVFQTRGRVDEGGVRYVVQQRSLLAADAGAVPTRAYDLLTGALVAETTADLTFDATGLSWSPGGTRSRSMPIASVDVVRSFRGPLDNLVANASFEEPGFEDGDVTSGQTDAAAAHWSMSGATESGPLGESLCERREVPAGGIAPAGALEPTFGDEHAAVFTDDAGFDFARPVVAQGGYAVVPREDGSAVQVEARLAFVPAGAFTAAHQTEPARLLVRVDTPDGTYTVQRRTVEARAVTLKGADARVPVEAVLGTFGGAVDGTPVAYPGTVLRFRGTSGGETVVARLTLTRTLVVGATSAVGDLDEDVPADGSAPLLFFASGLDGIVLHDLLTATSGVAEGAVSGTPPAIGVDGTPVEGPLVVWAEGARVDDTDPEAGRSRETWWLGNVLAAPRAGAAAGDAAPRQAVTGRVDRVSVDGPGLEALLPATDDGLPIGGGPLPDSPGCLLFGAGPNVVPTAQGTGTTWENVAEAGVPATSLGEAVARDALRQLAGLSDTGAPRLLRQIDCEFVLGGATYDAERAVLHRFGDEADRGEPAAAYWWDSMEWTPWADRLRIRGTELRLADLSGAIHEIELLS